jgi:hypothetical protein
MEGRGRGRPAAAGAVLLAMACLIAACAGEGPSSGGGGGGPKCTPQVDPAAAPTYAANIQPLYDKACAVAGCHVGVPPAQFLDLSAGKSYKQTINRKSTEIRSFVLVKPGDADVSYLFKKIRGDPDISGVLMPQGCPGAPLRGAACLNNDEIDAIRTWILACAPNN